nr:unnamed protein product [Callosobruchus analis]
MGNKYHPEEPAKFNPRLLIKNATLDEELKGNDKIVNDILRPKKLEGADDVTKEEFYTWDGKDVQLRNISISCSVTSVVSLGIWRRIVGLRCAGNRTVNSCSSDILKCINCTSYNSKFNTKLNSDHNASDRACPLYEDHIYKLKRRINYG